MNDDPKIGIEWTMDGKTFRIVQFIDEGGMGQVYEGVMTENESGRQEKCAVKILHRRKTGGTQDAGDRETRFLREINILQRFDSPHIIKVLANGYHEELGHYYVMEFIAGATTLQTLSKPDPIPAEFGERYLRHVLETLKLFAGENLIHRDITPKNIMVQEGVAKIADFGLGKLLGPELAEITTSGTSVGTPTCMSPEQAMGARDITSKTDIYSTGATFFQGIVGELLFPDPRIPVEMAAAHINQEPRWPQERGVDIPDYLADLLLMMVDKKPGNRPTADQALLWLDEQDPAEREGLRQEISALENPLCKRLGVRTSAELAHVLEEDREQALEKLGALDSSDLPQLADLHEQAGRGTPRYEPTEVSRHDHFMLSAFYNEQAGGLNDEAMAPKRVALEKRRLAMIDRRAGVLADQLATAKQGAAESPETEMISSQLEVLRALQRPPTHPLGLKPPRQVPTRKLWPLVVVGVSVLLVTIGVVAGLIVQSNSNRSRLRELVSQAEALQQQQKFDDAQQALADAKRFAASHWFMHDTTEVTRKIDAVAKKLADIKAMSSANLARLRTSLADARRFTKSRSIDQAQQALAEADRVLQNESIIKDITAERQTLASLRGRLADLNAASRADLDRLRASLADAEQSTKSRALDRAQQALAEADRIVRNERILEDITSLRGRLADLNAALAGEHIVRAAKKLDALSDPARTGAPDTAELIGHALNAAEASLGRAGATNLDSTKALERKLAALRTHFKQRKQAIDEYHGRWDKVRKNAAGARAEALWLGRYHFTRKPLLANEMNQAKSFFRQAGDAGKPYLDVIGLVRELRDPATQVLVVRGENGQAIRKDWLDRWIAAVDEHSRNLTAQSRERALLLLDPVAAGLGVDLDALWEKTEQPEANGDILPDLQALAEKAKAKLKQAEPQLDAGRLARFRAKLSALGYGNVDEYVAAVKRK